MKTILVLCFTELHKDPRVLREVQALKDDYYILTAGASPTGMEQEFILLKPRHFSNAHFNSPWLIRKWISFCNRFKQFSYSLLGENKYLPGYWDKNTKMYLKHILQHRFDLIIANDLNTLPLAYKAAKKTRARLIFDAHEYYPLEFENNPMWMKGVKPVYDQYCKTFLKKADEITVVSDTVGKEYNKNFGISYTVINNAANYYDLKVNPVNPTDIKIVHHGFAIPERKVEKIIEMFQQLDNRFSLHLILISNKHTQEYYQELRTMCSSNNRIFFYEPVSFGEIPVFLNKFDIGIHFWDVSNFNNYATIPNKFFEFIQARLMVGIGPSPELEKVVQQYALGVCSTKFDPAELAKKINSLSAEEIYRYKCNSDKASFKLSSENNKKIIKEVVDKLLVHS